MLANLIILFALPVAAGFAVLLSGKSAARKNTATGVFLLGLVFSVYSFFARPGPFSMSLTEGFVLSASYNVLAGFIAVFINLFALIVALYSGGSGEDGRNFYSYLLILAAFANLAVMAADFITLAFGWGAMLAVLYAMVFAGSPEKAGRAASVVGTADFMLILGLALYAFLSGSTALPPAGEGLALDSPVAMLAFVLLFAAAAGKAGAWPFHPWIPEISTSSSMSVMAILPASLDKLLGIYLLARVCTGMFVLNGAAMGLMLLVGGFTVLFAVLKALIQKDARKLLSYHAVSQVGYMVIGFGTGVPVGFAAGLFHMLNHAIYKTGLFLSAGAAGSQKGTFDIGKLGGLSKYMPVTFGCAVVFSLAISGVPPLNGFVSKWMVYQGAVSGLVAAEGGLLKGIFAVSLLAAMFGSALTLASFVKFLHSVFLGQESPAEGPAPEEAVPSIKYPLAVLALLCVVLGIFPGIFLSGAVFPWMPEAAVWAGQWDALAAFLLLGAGLLGGLVFVLKPLIVRKLRVTDSYYGGQEKSDEVNFPATEFYRTVQDIRLAAGFYRFLDLRFMNIYNVLASGLRNAGLFLYYVFDRGINLLTSGSGAAVLGISKIIRKTHTGNLDLYIIWGLLAMAVLFFLVAW